MVVVMVSEAAASEVSGAPNTLFAVSASRTSPTFSEVGRIMLRGKCGFDYKRRYCEDVNVKIIRWNLRPL